MYQIFIRDKNLNRIGEITDYQKLDLIPRFNAVGSFALDVPTDSMAAKELMKPQSGIIVRLNGQTVFSGPVTKRNRKWDKDGDVMLFSGVDDNIVLTNLALPEPNGNFALQDYDVRTGPAEMVMKQYVDVNIGPNAAEGRRRVNIEIDRGIGDTVTGRARFHPLTELNSSLAIAGGDIGHRVLHVGNELEYQVYQPSDKTKTAVFSPLLGNLQSFEYTSEDPTANYVYVGGGGEGKDRIILHRPYTESIAKYGRFESFVDQRDTTDTTELTQSLDEELSNKAEKASLSISPIDTDSVKFGRDYNLGDKVSVVLTQPNEIITTEEQYYFLSAYQVGLFETERMFKIQQKLDVITDIVREIKFTITPDGASVTPTIGTNDSTSNFMIGIFDKWKRAIRRVSKLERR